MVGWEVWLIERREQLLYQIRGILPSAGIEVYLSKFLAVEGRRFGGGI